MQWLQKLSDLWAQLSAREQRLALIVGGLVVLAAILWSIRGALDTVDELDRQIALAEDSIVSSATQIKVREAVEAAYEEVAWQHSSAWTAAEILDRLRNEIFRLAYVEPSPLNDNGVAEKYENGSGNLIRLPELGEGSLEDEEEGYREYKIRVRIDNEPFQNFVDYIERLQMSPQSLRIDGIDLRRDILTDTVSANLDITRIIVDRIEDTMDTVPQAPEQWVGLGCTVEAAPHAQRGDEETVVISPAGPKGSAYLELAFEGGGVYEVAFTARAEGNAVVTAYDTSLGAPLKGEITLSDEEGYRNYQMRLNLQGGEGTKTVRVPFVNLEGAGSRVTIGNVGVRKDS